MNRIMIARVSTPAHKQPDSQTSLAREASDRVANELGTDDQHEHGHDDGVVVGHPLLHLLQKRPGTRAHRGVDDNGSADANRPDNGKDGIGDRFLTTAEAGASDRSRRGDRQQGVLRVGAREENTRRRPPSVA